MAFMRKIDQNITLSELEALVLYRANQMHKQSGGTKSLAEAVGDYLHMLYKGLHENGDIEESYEDFEGKWFCDYYDDPDGEGYDCMINDLYEDMICDFLGYSNLTECGDYKEIEALSHSTSDSCTYYQNEDTGRLYYEDSDRATATTLFKRINQDISQLKNVK